MRRVKSRVSRHTRGGSVVRSRGLPPSTRKSVVARVSRGTARGWKFSRRRYEKSVPRREIDFAGTSYRSPYKVADSYFPPSPPPPPTIAGISGEELLLLEALSATSICGLEGFGEASSGGGGQSLKENQPLLSVIAFRSCLRFLIAPLFLTRLLCSTVSIDGR